MINSGKWWFFTHRRTWIDWYDPTIPRLMPEAPACYALSLNGSIVYVGQTVNLRSRFYTHGLRRLDEGSVWSKAWGKLHGDLRLKVKFSQQPGDWAMREFRLISRLAPIFNVRRA